MSDCFTLLAIKDWILTKILFFSNEASTIDQFLQDLSADFSSHKFELEDSTLTQSVPQDEGASKPDESERGSAVKKKKDFKKICKLPVSISVGHDSKIRYLPPPPRQCALQAPKVERLSKPPVRPY